MVLIRWADIGAATARVPARLADSLRRGVCQFRQANPYLFDSLPNLNPLAGPYTFNRAFWDEICNPEPLDGTYPNVASGGRCAAQYRWFVDWASPSVQGTRSDPFNATYQGPITNPRIQYSQLINVPQVRMEFSFTPANGVEQTFFIVNGDPDKMPFARAIRFERVDGLADNCGTQGVRVPVLPPVSNTFNTNITIGGSTFNTPITLGDIEVANNEVIDFTPTFNSQFGPFVFEIDGIRIDFGNEVVAGEEPGGGSTDLTPVINEVTQTRVQLSTEISEVITDIENLGTLTSQGLDELEALIRCYCGEENVTITAQSVASNTSGGVFNLPEGTIYVVVEGNGFNPNFLRSMEGSGGSPTVWFWGWYAIGYGSADGGDRTNLQYENHAIPVAEGASAINITCYTGTTASITAYVKEKNCNVNG